GRGTYEQSHRRTQQDRRDPQRKKSRPEIHQTLPCRRLLAYCLAHHAAPESPNPLDRGGQRQSFVKMACGSYEDPGQGHKDFVNIVSIALFGFSAGRAPPPPPSAAAFSAWI